MGFQFFLQIMIAAITPGTHPAIVRSTTNKMDPHPLSYTANGGNSTHKIALPKPIVFFILFFNFDLPLIPAAATL